MDIFFKTKKLERQCTDSRLFEKTWGRLQGKKIRQRLDDFRAADNLGEFEFLPGRCHELKGDRKGQLTLDLVHPRRLVFTPVDNPTPAKPDGGLDWNSVFSVVIIGIEDTHD